MCRNSPGPARRLALGLAVGLFGWTTTPAPTHAQVVAVTVGLTPSCPYGLEA